MPIKHFLHLVQTVPGMQEQSGMTGLASRVGWAVVDAASTEAGCAVAGFQHWVLDYEQTGRGHAVLLRESLVKYA